MVLNLDAKTKQIYTLIIFESTHKLFKIYHSLAKLQTLVLQKECFRSSQINPSDLGF